MKIDVQYWWREDLKFYLQIEIVYFTRSKMQRSALSARRIPSVNRFGVYLTSDFVQVSRFARFEQFSQRIFLEQVVYDRLLGFVSFGAHHVGTSVLAIIRTTSETDMKIHRNGLRRYLLIGSQLELGGESKLFRVRWQMLRAGYISVGVASVCESLAAALDGFAQQHTCGQLINRKTIGGTWRKRKYRSE